jgi:hypothetical protein
VDLEVSPVRVVVFDVLAVLDLVLEDVEVLLCV